MLARALVVLLLALNLGVAAWSTLRPQSAPPLLTAEASAERLQLLQEAPRAGSARRIASSPVEGTPVDAPGEPGTLDLPAPGAAPAAALPPEPAPPAEPVEAVSAVAASTAPARCFSVGPFDDDAARAGARRTLAALGATRVLERDETSAPRGWRVFMPAMADRAAAAAMAARIRAAGFDDLMVMPDGAGGDGIALGRYSAEGAARQRVTALRAKGFAAEAAPVGDVAVRRWLDVAATGSLDPARVRAGGIPLAPRDCGALS
jgi:hypothetical protein